MASWLDDPMGYTAQSDNTYGQKYYQAGVIWDAAPDQYYVVFNWGMGYPASSWYTGQTQFGGVFNTESAARAAMNKKVKAKLAKGYEYYGRIGSAGQVITHPLDGLLLSYQNGRRRAAANTPKPDPVAEAIRPVADPVFASVTRLLSRPDRDAQWLQDIMAINGRLVDHRQEVVDRLSEVDAHIELIEAVVRHQLVG